MLPRSLQIIRRFNHVHKPSLFLVKNDSKIEYDKLYESEDKLNENIQDIKTNVAKMAFYSEMTTITVCSYIVGQIIAGFLFK